MLSEGQVRAARASVTGGQGHEGTGRPAGEAEDLAVECAGLHGRLFDVLRGYCDTRGDVVHLGEDEGSGAPGW